MPFYEKISTHRRSHIGTHQRYPNHVGLLSFTGQILQSARNFRPYKRRSHFRCFVHCRGIHDLAWQSHSVLSYNQNKPEIVLYKKSTFHSKSAFNNGGVGGVIGMSTPLICFRNHYERIIALFVKRICNSIASYPFIV